MKVLGKPLQPKLAISDPNDVFEQEADRVAEQVMRMPEEEGGTRLGPSETLVRRRANAGERSIAKMPVLQRAEALGTMPASEGETPKEEGSRCPSWRADPQSISKRAGEFYARNHMTPTSQATVERIECEPPIANGNYGCYVHFSDGLVLRVIVRETDIVVGTGPGPITTLRPPPATPLCYYEYACPEGDLVLTVKKCQSAKPAGTSGPPAVAQRRAASGSPGPLTAPSVVQDVLASSGRPLDHAVRAFFEPRFGYDFGQVRIHSDEKASQSARAVNALAYTVGPNIVFRAGQFDPQTKAGRRLLAHELSHVVQQVGNGPGGMLRRAPVPTPDTVGPVAAASLSPDLTATDEVVIGGERFDVMVLSPQAPPDDPSARYRKTAEEYLGSYPNLGSGSWAFLVRQADGVFCQIGGNCLGWAYGTYGLNDPPESVWGLTRQYLESVGRPARGGRSLQETYLKQSQKEKIAASAVWDYFMKVEFDALPTEGDGDAHLALYGRGFGGPMDGPTHISFRTVGGELWVSKPSPSRFPILHERADQMSGGETGWMVRLYKRPSGPSSHVVLRAKQVEPG